MTNILIVDDSIVDCKLMEHIIKKSYPSSSIHFNYNGKRVLEQIMEQDICVVILDLMLENVNGIDLLKMIKRNKGTENLPVIVCSAICENAIIKETLMLGAYDYFEKPLSSSDIDFGFYLKVKNAMTMKQESDQIIFMSNHDELTGLGTRKYFETEMQKTMDQGILPFSIIIIDINGLKIINDAYGWSVGDHVLREISRILKKINTKGYTISRWGSDEIAILMPYEENDAVLYFLEQIKKEVQNSDGYNYNLSFGWATENRSLLDARRLIQKAEDSLFRNKIMEPTSIRRNVIDSIVKTLEQKNPREEMHSHRVSHLSGKIAEALGFSEYERRRVELAGLLHDIGKISIREEILNKPGKLDEEEWYEIKKHPENGFKILSTSVDTMEIANAVLAHHERWDGKGYPKGLKGEHIPIMARVICVADTFDAMTSMRPYKNIIGEKEAMDEIKKCAGTQFDPIVANAFLTMPISV
ncbi:MAG: hypothetical protein PWP24_1510 [Clostridiales bacterium]|nr:hypothetical protein [Clostridiales bacterium]